MQVNPSKFQAITLGKKNCFKKQVFQIDEAEIFCNETVKLFCIDIDSMLKFDVHTCISIICNKGAKKLMF